ncbi:MAG: hypothetical protein M1836_004106 [Candelina mexicana]|nr:MAG: hypothetical protein M1836_004106 [Candelina mexicana]
MASDGSSEASASVKPVRSLYQRCKGLVHGREKQAKMTVLLVMYTILFFGELGIGSWVHSLALVADAFHMLNDFITTAVALHATNLAQRKSPRKYTYGWQRATTLGAFFNGVFLLAFCVSITIEALQRLFEVPEVQEPMVILIVGAVGLTCNIAGLLLFGGHEHSHGGGHGHAHAKQETPSSAEQGKSRALEAQPEDSTATSGNNPERREGLLSQDPVTAPERKSAFQAPSSGLESFGSPGSESTTKPRPMGSPSAARKLSNRREHKRRTSASSRGFAKADDIPIHPTSFNEVFLGYHKQKGVNPDPPSDSEDSAILEEDEEPNEDTPLINKNISNGSGNGKQRRRSSHAQGRKSGGSQPELPNGSEHATHYHNKPKGDAAKGGHAHGDLNTRGVILHLFGDALGNVGVMIVALIIWKTPFWWRFYSDPVISLVIMGIILRSALPLCRAALEILFQAVPDRIDIEHIEADIRGLPGVSGSHDLHVWQLTDTTVVASVHVELDFDFQGEGAKRWMDLARQMRHCLHAYDIHSSTVQPEFRPPGSPVRKPSAKALDGSSDAAQMTIDTNGGLSMPKDPSEASSENGKSDAAICWLDCKDSCGDDVKCCTTSGNSSGSRSPAEQDHDH